MPARPTSLRLASDPAIADGVAVPVRRSVSLQRAAGDLDCSEDTVRRMVGKELEGHGLRSRIRVYVDSIEAYQRAHHLGAAPPPPARYAPPAVTETAEFRDILAGLQDLGLIGEHEPAAQPKRRRRA